MCDDKIFSSFQLSFSRSRLINLNYCCLCCCCCLHTCFLSIANGLTCTQYTQHTIARALTNAHTTTTTILYIFRIAKWFPVCCCRCPTVKTVKRILAPFHFTFLSHSLSLYLWFECTTGWLAVPTHISLFYSLLVCITISIAFASVCWLCTLVCNVCICVSRLENDFIHTHSALW